MLNVGASFPIRTSNETSGEGKGDRLLFLAIRFLLRVPYVRNALYSTRTSGRLRLPYPESREWWCDSLPQGRRLHRISQLARHGKSQMPGQAFWRLSHAESLSLVVQPATDAVLSPFMQWWMTSHVRRYHRHYRSHGHVWQGRFKSFPIQQDGHLLTTLRYVLRNPVRAGLVEHAIDWPWPSLRLPHLSDPSPVEPPTEWLQWIDQPLFDQELTTLRICVNRQQPFGTADWQATAAASLGLSSTLRRRGRPRRHPEK